MGRESEISGAVPRARPFGRGYRGAKALMREFETGQGSFRASPARQGVWCIQPARGWSGVQRRNALGKVVGTGPGSSSWDATGRERPLLWEDATEGAKPPSLPRREG